MVRVFAFMFFVLAENLFFFSKPNVQTETLSVYYNDYIIQVYYNYYVIQVYYILICILCSSTLTKMITR